MELAAQLVGAGIFSAVIVGYLISRTLSVALNWETDGGRSSSEEVLLRFGVQSLCASTARSSLQNSAEKAECILRTIREGESLLGETVRVTIPGYPGLRREVEKLAPNWERNITFSFPEK